MVARFRRTWSPKTTGSPHAACGTARSAPAASSRTSRRSTSSALKTESLPNTGSPSTGFAPFSPSDCSLRRSKMSESATGNGSRSTTAIVGVGNIGGTVGRHLVRGGESVVLASRDESQAKALADELGPLARAASVEAAIAEADAVVLAVWLDQMKELLPRIASRLEG